jgi:2-hydroxychromene-2-carboxylate isomerase
MQRIDFYFGLGSRYSYLAFTQIERIERVYGCHFALHPISSVELFTLRQASPFEREPASGQYDWDWRRRDAERWAGLYGVPFREPAPLPADHRLMARACHAADLQGQLRAYAAALFRAVFADHATIDADACAVLAAGLGMDWSRLAHDMTSAAVEARVSAVAGEAKARGAFGVPTFFVGDEMFWGNDRLPLLEHWLRRNSPPGSSASD